MLDDFSTFPRCCRFDRAKAWDAEDGDVTGNMLVDQDSSDCSLGDSCPMCSVAAVVTGECFPGVYTYIYRVTDRAGNAASDFMVVAVIQQVCRCDSKFG